MPHSAVSDLDLQCLPRLKSEDPWSCKHSPDNLVLVYILMLLYTYIAPGQGHTTPWGQMMSTESPYHFAHLLQVLKQSLKYDFKNILKEDFIHVYSPKARAENPLGPNFWCQQKALITSTICCKFQTNLFEFWLHTHFLMFFHMYIALGQGQTTLCGQIPDVNRKALSLCPFVASFKKYLWSLILYIIFHVLIHVCSLKTGADNSLASEFLYKHKPFVSLVICCKFLPLNVFVTIFPI